MFVRSCKQGITHLNVPQHSRPSVCNFGGTLGVWDKSPHGTPRTQPQVGIWARFLFGNGFSSNWIGSDRIDAYRTTLMSSLDSTWRRLMLVMSYHNPALSCRVGGRRQGVTIEAPE